MKLKLFAIAAVSVSRAFNCFETNGEKMRMKLFGLAALVLMVAGFCSKANAQEVPSGPPAQVCNATDNLYGFAYDINGNIVPLSFAECVRIVAYFNGASGAFSVAYCNFLGQSGTLEELGFSTVPQCIAYNAGRNQESVSAARVLLTSPLLAAHAALPGSGVAFPLGTFKLE
jgi:hypothetical protein